MNFPAKPKNITPADWESQTKARTTQKYSETQRELFMSGHGKAIDASGKIDDKVLISLVIMLEFGDLKSDSREQQQKTYQASLSALSFQFAHNSYEYKGPPICGRECADVNEQLAWLQAFEAVRNRDIGTAINPGESGQSFEAFTTDAARVASGRFGSYSSFGNGPGTICAASPYSSYCVR